MCRFGFVFVFVCLLFVLLRVEFMCGCVVLCVCVMLCVKQVELSVVVDCVCLLF